MLSGRSKSLILQFVFFSLTWSFAAGKRCHEKPCTIHDDGKYYNLNPLQATKDYGPIKTDGGHNIVLNVCKSVTTETWNLKVDKPEDVGAFIHKDRGDFSIGSMNTSLTMKNGRPLLIMEHGSPCPSGGNTHATSAIDFICDTSIPGAGVPILLFQFPPEEEDACNFGFEWRTPFACATTEPSDSWGTIPTFIAASLSLLMLYLITGTLYNRYVLQLSGPDQIPQFSPVSLKYHATAAAGWVRDWAGGVDWAEGGRKVAGGVNSVSHQFMQNGGDVEQQRVPNGQRDRNVNSVSHQFMQSGGAVQQPQETSVRLPNANQGDRTVNSVSHQFMNSGGTAKLPPKESATPAPGVDQGGRVRRFEMESTPATREEQTSMLDAVSDDESEEEDGDEEDGSDEEEEEAPSVPTKQSVAPQLATGGGGKGPGAGSGGNIKL